MSDNVEESAVYPKLHDFEADVFNEVYPVLEGIVPSGNFRSEYVYEPDSFPLCTLIRMDSVPDWNRESTSDFEDYSIDTYEAHAYALTMDECKEIMNTLSEKMRSMNFRRLQYRPVLNGNDINIAQIVARFEHKIDRNGVMYR